MALKWGTGWMGGQVLPKPSWTFTACTITITTTHNAILVFSPLIVVEFGLPLPLQGLVRLRHPLNTTVVIASRRTGPRALPGSGGRSHQLGDRVRCGQSTTHTCPRCHTVSPHTRTHPTHTPNEGLCTVPTQRRLKLRRIARRAPRPKPQGSQLTKPINPTPRLDKTSHTNSSSPHF